MDLSNNSTIIRIKENGLIRVFFFLDIGMFGPYFLIGRLIFLQAVRAAFLVFFTRVNVVILLAITTLSIEEEQLLYFEAECPLFSDTVFVELKDLDGLTFLYCSTSESTPGPLTTSTIANTTRETNSRSCSLNTGGSTKVSSVL